MGGFESGITVVSPCYVLSFSGQDRQGRRTAFWFGFPMTCVKGLTPRPFFISSNGRIHRISIRKVMKSGASQTSENIRLFPVVHSGDGREARAVTKRGTALFLRLDHLRPSREGSGTMPCRKRVSERLRRASTHYAIRMFFLSPERGLRVRRPCVSLDHDPEKVGTSAIPEIWEGKHREMQLRTPREGRSFSFPNPDNLFIRSAAGLCLVQNRRSRRTPFSAAC